ncbi:MAG: ATP-binding cassette domain-containing protein, partial [Chthoniobacteraceae bacterium]
MIEVRKLCKSFSGRPVLCDVDLTMEEGKTLVVIGRSGCGKSVVLKHLIGLLKPDSGQVLVDGEDITGLPERKLTAVRRKVGMLFQSAALFDSMSVEANLAFPLREQGMRDETEIDARVVEALSMVELGGEQLKMPADLSGGMRKRVGLARTIALRPEVLLYDEPTTGLDPINTTRINNVIVSLKGALNVTSVVVTHDMGTAFAVSSRLA